MSTLVTISLIVLSLVVLVTAIVQQRGDSCPEIPGCQCANHRVRCKLTQSQVRYFKCLDSWSSLELTLNDQESFDSLHFSTCSNLLKLTFQSSRFNILRSNKFTKLYKLKTFTVNRCALQTIEPQALKGFASLDRIIIRDNVELKTLPGDLLQNFIVKEVIVTGNGVEHIDSALFHHQLLYWEMETLDLSHNKIIKIDSNAFSQLVKLQVLDLSYNLLEFITPDTIPNVNNLKLSNNKIKAVTTLSALSASLQTLDLKNNEISSLAALPSFAHLKTLNLAHNLLTQFPPKKAWKRFPSLTTLSIEGHRFTCAPLDSLPATVTLIQFSRCDKGSREPRDQDKNTRIDSSHQLEEEQERDEKMVTRRFHVIIGVVSVLLAISVISLIAIVLYVRRPSRHRGTFHVTGTDSDPQCHQSEAAPLTNSGMDSLKFATPVREHSLLTSEFSSRPPESMIESLIDTIGDSADVEEALGPESEPL